MTTKCAMSQRASLPKNETANRNVWMANLKNLPLRALVAFIQRCMRRIEVLYRLEELTLEAYSTGVDVDGYRPLLIRRNFGWHDMRNPCSLIFKGASENILISSYGPIAAADAALKVVFDDQTSLQVAADIKKLLDLKLGKPREPGEPIRWNDSRLGPLWPDGPPKWYVDAEQACRELEEVPANASRSLCATARSDAGRSVRRSRLARSDAR